MNSNMRWASKMISHNYKKMIFQKTRNSSTDRTSHNFLMQVGILTLLFNKSESYPLLLGLFLNEGCVRRFWISGLFDFGANGQNP